MYGVLAAGGVGTVVQYRQQSMYDWARVLQAMVSMEVHEGRQDGQLVFIVGNLQHTGQHHHKGTEGPWLG